MLGLRAKKRNCNQWIRKTRRLAFESLEERRLLAGNSIDFGRVAIDDATHAELLSENISLEKTFSLGSDSISPNVSNVTDTIELFPNLPNSQPVGTTIAWTVNGAGTGTEVYRFLAGRVSDSLRLIYDYRDSNVFEWTPIEDGVYLIAASVNDLNTGTVTTAFRLFRIKPQPFALTTPVVTPTDNTLVALYSAPDYSELGDQMRVRFFVPGGGAITASTTNTKPIEAGHSSNFYLGGMRPETTYVIQHEILDANGDHVEFGPFRTFTTGSLPANLPFPDIQVLTPPSAGDSLRQDVFLHNASGGNGGSPAFSFATDLQGKVIWYLDQVAKTSIFRQLEGGTFLQWRLEEIIREIDLAGNVLLETNIDRINEQLAAMGHDTGNSIHHEARRLPNGHTAILVSVEKILEDVQGPGPVDILGDMVVVLDENFQVVWVWNSFDHLDITRTAILGERCLPGLPGCPPVLLAEEANDWLHTNTITYDTNDANLLLSMRHQDWIIKIDYADGNGNGDVIWRLGPEGDFTIDSIDPFPFFSHQHDPNFDAQNRLVVYDNANTRRAIAADPSSINSRGQVYEIDEQNMTVTLALDVDLGDFASAVGSAQPLSNGNYHFNSGVLGEFPNATSRVDEVRPDGTITFSMEFGAPAYRSHRMASLYSTSPQSALALNSQGLFSIDGSTLRNLTKSGVDDFTSQLFKDPEDLVRIKAHLNLRANELQHEPSPNVTIANSMAPIPDHIVIERISVNQSTTSSDFAQQARKLNLKAEIVDSLWEESFSELLPKSFLFLSR